nr:replication protein A 70 kDa DNA-binding subunit B [Tanacetum cinerariifolium]
MRVPHFDNNRCGFKFEPFSKFTAMTFTENEVVDVIGTIISIFDAIPFNNVGQAKIGRILILEDVDGVKLEWCFFDGWSDKFTKLYSERENMGHVVVIEEGL